MNLPRPSPTRYLGLTLTVLAILAVFQYFGIFVDGSGTIDWGYLVGVGLFFPFFTYVLSVVAENTRWLPNWDEMNQNQQ